MNIYDYLVSLGEQTAESFGPLFHDIGSLMIVFFPFAFILAFIFTVIDYSKKGDKKE